MSIKLNHKNHRNTLRTKIYDDETGLFVNHYDTSVIKEWYSDFSAKANSKQHCNNKKVKAILNSIVDKGIEESVLRKKIRDLYLLYRDFKYNWNNLWQNRFINRDIYEPESGCLYKDRDTNLVYYCNTSIFKPKTCKRYGLSKTEFRKEKAKVRNKPNKNRKKNKIVKYDYFKTFNDKDLQIYFKRLIKEEDSLQETILRTVKSFRYLTPRNANEHEIHKYNVRIKQHNYKINKELKVLHKKLNTVQAKIERLLEDDLSLYYKSKYYLKLRNNENI